MKNLKRIVGTFLASLLMATLCMAQAPAAKKPMVFRGKVEGINAKEGTLKVNNEKVEGWMDAMLMDYKVDDPAVLKTVKPGDTITATVYAGDMELHKVQVAKAK